MREARTPNHPAGLGQCMLDCDAEATSQSRRQRARSFVVSVLMQALLVTALLVAPLLAAGKIPLKAIFVTPPPPYHGRPVPQSTPQAEPRSNQAQQQRPRNLDPRTVAPPRIPREVRIFDDRDNPPVGPATPGNNEPGVPWGVPRIGESPIGRIPTVAPPAPAAPRETRITRGGWVQEALLTHRVDPVYPPLCKQIRVQGEVKLHAIVGRDGAVRELEFQSGHACFIQNTMQAVGQWRYRPTLLNGEPVEVETTITIIFTLNR